MDIKHINDLNTLTDIIDTIEPNNINELFENTHYYDDLFEAIYIFVDEYIDDNLETYKLKKFEELLFDNIYNSIIDIYDGLIKEYDINIEELIINVIQFYFNKNNNHRSFCNSPIINRPDVKIITEKLEIIKNKYQPEQKSDDWYIYRYNGLTASNLWKAIDSQASINSLIYSKCEPLNIQKYKGVNIGTPFHHGHKYEPLSIQVYEDKYNTKVGEYGCIQHSEYECLKASPDGINIDPSSNRYGRLVEVKNPTTRVICGIPKLEYWVQMQHQMEICDLDECDFLETAFKEYENEKEFLEDGETFNKTKDGKLKGILVMFDEGTYEYPPLNLTNSQFDEWYDNLLNNSKKTWIQNIYWYLETFSNVLVLRNKKWYKSVLPKLIKVWETIIYEKQNGYQHRKSSSRKKKKILKLDDNDKRNIKTLLNNLPDSPVINNDKIIIKVRTESFDNK
mgnify:CR=1 FL=1